MTYTLYHFKTQSRPQIEPAASIQEGAWLFLGNQQGMACLRAVLPPSEELTAYFPDAQDVTREEKAGTITDIIMGNLQ
jgi:hypothetical protein